MPEKKPAKLYTLEEAQQELVRRRCLIQGHTYTVHAKRGTKEYPTHVTCVCGQMWNVERKVII